MSRALLVKLRATSPWRIGPDSGARDRVDRIYHSDTLYSAITGALRQLGLLEPWLAATALHPEGARVRFTSMFPWMEETLFVVPPRHTWPPPLCSKLRAQGARFMPLSLAAALRNGVHLEEDAWEVDGESQCLIASGKLGPRRGPFRLALRSTAAVDRLEQRNITAHQTACLEFDSAAGFWCLAEFAGEEAEREWLDLVQAAFRLLADSGFGGERSRGWGACEIVEFRGGELSELLSFPPPPEPRPALDEQAEPAPAPIEETAYWLLSLYSPASNDSVDWKRGSYQVLFRGGRVESPQAWGAEKKKMRMVAEGSVLAAERTPVGAVRDVAPEGFPHPVYRAGFAVSLPVPYRGNP